jgi:hypothetical protein
MTGSFWLKASLAVGLLGAVVAICEAASIYRITSKTKDGETKQYKVTFGPTKVTNRLVAFCPKNKKFVYLIWKDKTEKAPEPVSSIWDHRTGETVPLYKFPDSPHPLPAIARAEDIKVCPFTGDTKLKVERIGFAD